MTAGCRMFCICRHCKGVIEMKRLLSKKYTKSVVTILTTVILTVLIGFGSFAYALGNRSNSDKTDTTDTTDTKTTTSAQTAAEGVNVTEYGANGSDKKDDTAAIQAALDKNSSVYIPGGTYYINVDEMLRLNSGQTLTLSDEATLQALPTSSSLYGIIAIFGVSDVTVTGGRIVGDRWSHEGTQGEWGMGIYLGYGASNVEISDIYISDCWGDGVYFGNGDTPISYVTIDNVTCDNNRRQGMSISNAIHITVTNSTFKNTHGTAPEAGIDIEPDPGNTLYDITIQNTQCIGNAGSGIDIMGISEHVDDIDIIECELTDNSGMGLRIYKASDVCVSDTVTSNNFGGIEIPGDASNLEFSGVTVTDNSWRGVSFVTTDQLEGCSEVSFESCVFSNNSKNYPNAKDGIRIDCWDQSGFIRDVTFSNCQFYDDQASKTQRYGLTVGFTSGCMSGIVVESNCSFYGNIVDGYLGGTALRVL